MWGESAGASVIFPTEVMVFGKPQPNPAPLKDPVTGDWMGWVVRAAAFRYSAMGIPMVSDRTVIFDIVNHKHIDFLAKAKKTPQAFKVRAKGAAAPADDGSWIEYPFDSASSLWVNASHGEALDWYSEISQMIKNSLQLAQTHAARNAMKHLSGIQKSPGKKPVWDVQVIAWRPTSGGLIKWDPTTYKDLQKKVSGLIDGDRSEFKQVELKTGVDYIGEEDRLAVAAGEVDETTQGQEEVIDLPGQGEDGGKSTGQEQTDDDKVLKNLAVTKKNFPQEYAAACQGLGIEPDAGVDVAIAVTIIKTVSRMIDQAQG
jgi:hypothetical protein